MEVEEDLREFSGDAINKMVELVRQLRFQEIPKDFDADHVELVWSKEKNIAFLKKHYDEDYIALNCGRIEKFYICDGCDKEGFWNDIQHPTENNEIKKWCQNWINEKEKERQA